jgi:phosphohistidine phosphatase SixA
MSPSQKSPFPLFHNWHVGLLVTSVFESAENKIPVFLVSPFLRAFQTLELAGKTCFAIDFIFPHSHLPSSNFPTKQST